MKKRVIFTDQLIVDFCTVTRDTNEVHDPGFMGSIGKRVIVPGMFAFACAAGLSADYLKSGSGRIRVCFNTLLSSGDFADLVAVPETGIPGRIRLSAINHKDTLASREEYTHIDRSGTTFVPQTEGTMQHLPVTPHQVETFGALAGCADHDVRGFLFAVAYASHALFERIASAETDTEQEIDRLINGTTKVSPFYHMLEIHLPEPFVALEPKGMIDYRIHFEREKLNRNYTAKLQCEQDGKILYRSVYKLVGIPDAIILRMAKNQKQ